MRTAVLVADLYEDTELLYPYYRLQEAGHDVEVIGADANTVYQGKKGTSMTSTMSASDANPDDFDAVVIPGGYSPDHMRRNAPMVDFVREMGESGKPVAAICHAPWMLASAGLLEGRKATSFYSIKDDVTHAGAEWVDDAAVQDGNIITSRHPGDLPAFMRTLLAATG